MTHAALPTPLVARRDRAQLREWKMVFEKREKRQPTRADMLMAPPELRNMARRLGLLDNV